MYELQFVWYKKYFQKYNWIYHLSAVLGTVIKCPKGTGSAWEILNHEKLGFWQSIYLQCIWLEAIIAQSVKCKLSKGNNVWVVHTVYVQTTYLVLMNSHLVLWKRKCLALQPKSYLDTKLKLRKWSLQFLLLGH